MGQHGVCHHTDGAEEGELAEIGERRRLPHPARRQGEDQGGAEVLEQDDLGQRIARGAVAQHDQVERIADGRYEHRGRADQHLLADAGGPELAATISSIPRKPAVSARPMRQSSLSPSSMAPSSAVSAGEMKLMAMASASGRRPSAKKKD